MCAIGEETGPSARNPAANNSLVGIVATHSLISRAGLIPASVTRDRPGVLCRTVGDAAIVLGVLAGYDPKDSATVASIGQQPREPYERFAARPSLKGVRIGVVREFMQPFTKADEDSIRIANEALADLAKAGAVLVDPGPNGQLFKEAIGELVPSQDTAAFTATFKELFAGSHTIDTLLDLSQKRLVSPSDATLRIAVDANTSSPGEVQYALNRYLRERGDKAIQNIQDLIDGSTFYTHSPIEGVAPPPKGCSTVDTRWLGA